MLRQNLAMLIRAHRSALSRMRRHDIDADAPNGIEPGQGFGAAEAEAAARRQIESYQPETPEEGLTKLVYLAAIEIYANASLDNESLAEIVASVKKFTK